MKNLVYAIVAVSVGMLLTGGVVVLARGATPPEVIEVDAHLDSLIARQLDDVKHRL